MKKQKQQDRGVFAFKGGTFWSDCDGFSLFDVISIAMTTVYLIIVYKAVVQESVVAIDVQSNFNHLMIVIIGAYAGDQITTRITDTQKLKNIDRRTMPPSHHPHDNGHMNNYPQQNTPHNYNNYDDPNNHYL